MLESQPKVFRRQSDHSTLKKTSPTGAQVVILNEAASQVLLVKREDFRVWTIPGGRIEPGESPEAAAQREALEETGFSVRTSRFIGEYWRPQMPNGGALVFAFVGHITGGNGSKHDWEALAVEWFDINNLPKQTLAFARQVIEDARLNGELSVQRTQLLPLWQVTLLQFGLVVRNMRNRFLRR